MMMRRQTGSSKSRAAIIILFIGFLACGLLYPRVMSSVGASFGPTGTPKPKATVPARATVTAPKFTDFPHGGKQHGKLSCNSCHKFPTANWKHVRKETDAFPDVTDYPRHESCLKCHRQEFYTTARPRLCSICHTNPGPGNSARYAFPNPREVFDLSAKGKQAVSDFAITFPHNKHIETAAPDPKAPADESCAACHQTYLPQGNSEDEYLTKPPEKLGDAFWLKKGTFKTTPISHATCFTCHSPDTGILPEQANCAACHKLADKPLAADFDPKLAAGIGDLDKITLTSWRRRDSSGVFRHEFPAHSDLECANCHNIAAIDTTNALTKKVPVTSCNMCHITETSDDGGILNFEIDARKKDAAFQCVKCHITFGKMPVPESHIKAIAALSGK